ncbi:MAG: dihydropteroate synthase [bacterium]
MTPALASTKLEQLAQLFQRQDKIIVMGVLNVTPDSFSDGGQHFQSESAIRRALEMAEQGADIIDIGGESSRPGSQSVSVAEELRRVLPVIEAVSAQSEIPISIDTMKSEVAEAALSAGATIVNDVSGLQQDPEIAAVAARHGAGLILMHMRGTPATMQADTEYDDLIIEVTKFLTAAVWQAERSGVSEKMIMVDPGIGFGKDTTGNLELIRSVGRLRRELNKPVLVGASRKSFIGRLTGAVVDNRLPGSLAAITAAVINGAAAVRVHDVAASRQAVDIAIKLRP